MLEELHVRHLLWLPLLLAGWSCPHALVRVKEIHSVSKDEEDIISGHKEWAEASQLKESSRVFITLGETGASPFPNMLSALIPVSALRKPEAAAPSITTYTVLFCHTHGLICYFWVVFECWTIVGNHWFFSILEKGAARHCLAKKKREFGREKNHIHMKDSKQIHFQKFVF